MEKYAMNTEFVTDMEIVQTEMTLLGAGNDITGQHVEYWGHTWVVEEKNYLGDWTVYRFENREDGRVKITSSISPLLLPATHPHFAQLVTKS